MARSGKSLKILFISDPLEKFDPVAETTLFIMREAQKRGHQIFSTTPPELNAKGPKVNGRVKKIKITQPRKRDWFQVIEESRKPLTYFDAIMLRKDPPFDTNYLHHLYLLELVSGEVYMMNHPSGILVANEKLFPLPFTDRIPETLVSAHPRELSQFVEKHPKGTIIKPLQEAGGRGIFYIKNPKSDNIRVILETATENFSKYVIAQAYLPAAKKGDKRILLLGQEVLGAFIRKPVSGEHRANLHAGGSAHPAKVSRKDQELVGLLAPSLVRLGLDFVGLDIIGDSLIEVNITSPMGIHEINKTAKTHCEKKVLNYLEDRVNNLF